jgi:hypothetical protein
VSHICELGIGGQNKGLGNKGLDSDGPRRTLGLVERSKRRLVGVDTAYDLAESLLANPLPRRWRHSVGVGKASASLGPILGERITVLEAAALLHDIGYAPDLVVTGFHPIDGAIFLRDEVGADPELVGLVAHHSCAEVEAEERNLLDLGDL